MRVDPLERDVLDDDRLPFCDLDGDGDLVLVRVQLDIDADDLGIRISAIGVGRLDPLDVAVELCCDRNSACATRGGTRSPALR